MNEKQIYSSRIFIIDEYFIIRFCLAKNTSLNDSEEYTYVYAKQNL